MRYRPVSATITLGGSPTAHSPMRLRWTAGTALRSSDTTGRYSVSHRAACSTGCRCLRAMGTRFAARQPITPRRDLFCVF